MSQLAALVRASKAFDTTDQPTADDTVTIAGVAYTFKASVGSTANEVLIGATEGATNQNLVDAINGTGTAGTQYGSATVENPHCYAELTDEDTITVYSKLPGTIGNFITIAEAHDAGAWAGAATALSGGTGSLHDAIEGLRTGNQIPAVMEQFLLELTSGGADA